VTGYGPREGPVSPGGRTRAGGPSAPEGWLTRAATEHDAAACAAIYAPYVTGTAITFENDPPTAAEMAERIRAACASHAWLVAEEGGQVAGYAYATPFKTRPAYRWTCVVSVYLAPGRHRAGGGRALYEALFARVAERGFRSALAGMTLPNQASAALHRAMRFEQVGVFPRMGWKNGAWHDVAWLRRDIAAGADPPAEPR